MENNKPQWTKKQIEFLKENINKMFLWEMAKLPIFSNRTYKSLQHKSSRLGLRRDWTGENNPMYKGRVLVDGYIWLCNKWECPYSNKKGRVQEHKFVWWEKYGKKKPILSGEVIHHINEDKIDNRIENLQKLKNSEHISQHKMEWWKTKDADYRKSFANRLIKQRKNKRR